MLLLILYIVLTRNTHHRQRRMLLNLSDSPRGVLAGTAGSGRE